MIRIYRKTIRDNRLHELKSYEKGSWVHVVDPSIVEINGLEKELGLDRGLLTDALDLYEVPRLEVEDSVIYAFASYPIVSEGRIATSPFTLIIGREHIVTICIENCEFVEDIISSSLVPTTTQKIKFITYLFSRIISDFNRSILSINKSVHRLSRQPGRITNKDIVKLVGYEETVNIFISDLSPMSYYLDRLLSGKYLKLFEEDKDLIEDILLSASQIVDISSQTLKVISNTREAYSAIVTNNLNQVMKVLTVMTVILTVPTIIASLYGMNVPLPLGTHQNAFGFIVVSIFSITTLLLVVFKKNDWLWVKGMRSVSDISGMVC